ncbi:MAG: DNA gyrase subunit A [candidate division Zixibacteria bacterium RBG-1]|nr:MAG: DNA gyrase subunit A [candidate division Zixibacteria bacterium RBG-1]
MPFEREKIVPTYIEEEMKSSYIDYSMSVITARALPDVRDGLKPSNRRILVAMNDLNLAPGRPHRKCAKIAGDTSGNYHPHGEQVVYPTLVRMAQDFNMRCRLVDGQGNFGSIDGDAPAAMRYTEARLTPLAMEMLEDLEKDTVNFVSNYDETRKEPTVLPSKFPNLICNGSSGIAVGMATNIPPHNLGEAADALLALIDDPEIEDEEIFEHILGPDFPTGGIINGKRGIIEAYKTGKGKIILKARANIETEKSGRQAIVVTEIPYQVNKSSLLERIAQLARDKQLEGISDLRDESDREGMRIVIELKRDSQPEIVLNQLFKQTQMQETFGIIMLALVEGQPKILTLREILTHFIGHRHNVVTRRTKFDLKKAEEKAHILEGLKICIENIDAIIKLIKGSKTPLDAKENLMKKYKLSEIQAQAILDMTLRRLTNLEREKIEQDYLDTIKFISELKGILDSQTKRMKIIKDELLELKKKYADPRRTEILEAEEGEFTLEDLIAEEDMVITITHSGYVKRLGVHAYRKQGRGGKGVIGIETREEDFVEHLFIASTHDYILFFTNKGKCHWLKVHEIPQAGRAAKGKPIINLLELQEGEKVKAYVPVKKFDDKNFIIMATKNGIVKKSSLTAFSNPRRGGIIAIGIEEKDELIGASQTDGSCDIVLATCEGQAVRFPEDKVREMGRQAYGVKGITLEKNDFVIGMVVIKRDSTLLSVTENGYGKRSPISDYRLTNRGGKGVINIKTTDRNGKVVAIKEVLDEDELMLITQRGMIIRLPVKTIKVIGRNTQGVRLINLDSGDKVTDVARVIKSEEEEKAEVGVVAEE